MTVTHDGLSSHDALARKGHGRSPLPPLSQPPRTRRCRTPTFNWLEVTVVALLSAQSVIVHHPVRMLTKPLWLDENWVAASIRAPLSEIIRVSSSTPLAFTLLLRLLPHQAPSQLRLLPLIFTGATGAVAWVLANEIHPRRWTNRVLACAATAFMP